MDLSPVARSGRVPQILRDVPKSILFGIFGYLSGRDLAQFIIACNTKMVFSNGAHRFQVDVFNCLKIGRINSEIVNPEAFRKRVVTENALVRHLGMIAKRGCLELIKVVITPLDKAGKSLARFNAIKGAAYSGRLEIIQFLYNNEQIPMLDREAAVICAAANGQLTVIQTILKHGIISILRRGEAVMQAACAGHHLCLQFLLENGQIDELIRVKSLSIVAKKGDLLCLQAWLKKFGRFVLDVIRQDPLIEAAKGGHFDCVKMLLNGLRIKPPWLELVIKAAHGAGKSEIAAYLETWKPEEQKSPS